MAKKENKQTSKIKKKRWFTIIAPPIFNNCYLGESIVAESEELLEKTIEVNLMSITNDIKKQNINMKFRVARVVDGKGVADPIEYKMSGSFIKKLVRRKKNKLDISFSTTTKDEMQVIIKLLIITGALAHHSTVADLRRKAVSLTEQFIKKFSYIEIVEQIVQNQLQKSLRETLKKIYPIKINEVRYFGLDKTKKAEN
jgi:small subunit ribosomal protein S3Ae